MRKATLAAAMLGTLAFSAAQAGTLIPVPLFTNSTATYAYGINNNNTIAGSYIRNDSTQHGFIGQLDGNGYSTFDFGAGGHTYAFALSNEGWVTGLDNNPNGECPTFGCEYVRQPSGEPDQILRDGVGLDGITGQIVKNQKFVAEYWTLDHNQNVITKGYFGLASASGAAWVKDLKFPVDSPRVRLRGYGKGGEVLGYYRDVANQDYPGFILLNKILTSVTYPGAYFTEFEAINAKGVIVGGWQDQNGTTGQPFIYDAAKNTFKLIKVPGSAIAIARGINDLGLVTIFSDVGGFIYCSKKRTCPAAQGAIEVPEEVVPAGRVRWMPCKDGCVAPHPRNVKPVNAAALRAAMTHDRDLRLMLNSPYMR